MSTVTSSLAGPISLKQRQWQREPLRRTADQSSAVLEREEGIAPALQPPANLAQRCGSKPICASNSLSCVAFQGVCFRLGGKITVQRKTPALIDPRCHRTVQRCAGLTSFVTR